jgi:hypothetical protein
MEVPRKGVPASIATEYAQHGIYLIRANNDRVAGYARILELLHVEEDRIPPPWAAGPGRGERRPAALHLRDLQGTNPPAQERAGGRRRNGRRRGRR